MSPTAELEVAGRIVSRETLQQLREFEALVRRWNPAINLVSKASLPVLWERHIVDSAQLLDYCPAGAKHWVDFGAGGGFPGLVVAILAQEAHADLHFTLVEADSRKAIFLRQAVQAMGLAVTVANERIEMLPKMEADVVSARALASLPELLGLAVLHLRNSGVAIFPKGARHSEELASAQRAWNFDVETHPSRSEPGAAILVIRNIDRAKQN
jgi:16S rRNA (guanine527-N7)-methyltransferase